MNPNQASFNKDQWSRRPANWTKPPPTDEATADCADPCNAPTLTAGQPKEAQEPKDGQK